MLPGLQQFQRRYRHQYCGIRPLGQQNLMHQCSRTEGVELNGSDLLWNMKYANGTK